MLLLTKKPRLFLFADMISQSVAPNCPSICRPLAETLHLAFSPHPRRHNNAHLRWSLWSINHKRNFGAGLVLSQTRLFRWKKLQHPSLQIMGSIGRTEAVWGSTAGRKDGRTLHKPLERYMMGQARLLGLSVISALSLMSSPYSNFPICKWG